MASFSEYTVYVDESGNHGFVADNHFPVFVLAFCIVLKREYVHAIVPAVQEFKFRYWGHDSVILHGNAIRKRKGDFSFLMGNRELRQEVLTNLTRVMRDAPMDIIASVIDSARLREVYATSHNPYKVALYFCLERLFDFLISRNQEGKIVHITFESRGPHEDLDLTTEFNRICFHNRQWNGDAGERRFTRIEFRPQFAKKSTNLTGLQLADLVARPVGLQYFRPGQPNRAYEAIQSKIRSREVFPHMGKL